ncbi:MAG: YqgE/AlgH family protein [Prolixibacteraceae bacterium]|jgi:putative transcriptional regulator|nr:YqgE/AlgH family protein [Prolixibacteraceae bacterium]
MLLDLDIFKIESELLPKQGRVLIAEPFLPGDYFGRSTVLLVQCSEEGDVGFILNKPTDLLVKDLFKGFPDFDANAFLGGPVSNDKLFFLHTLGDKIPDSLQVSGDLFWSGNFDHLTALISAGLVEEEEVRFFLGYAGWSAGQLAAEIADHSWVVIEPSIETILSSDENFWNESVQSIGGNALLWQNFPENPELN